MARAQKLQVLTQPRPRRSILSEYWRMDGAGKKAGSTASDEASIASALVARVHNGDKKAENELVAHYSRGLLYMLRRRTNGDMQLAEDVHQDVFRIVIEKLRADGIQDGRKLAGYIHSTGKNVLIGILRRRQRRNTYADSDLIEATADEANTQANHVEQEQLAVKVRQLLQELSSDRDRAILTRFYLHQEDKSNICQALDLSDLHFNRVLYRAKKRFREIIENEATNAVDAAERQ